MGILQAKILEWVARSSPRGSSQPRDQTQVSCIAGRFFTIWATREVHPKMSMNWWLGKREMKSGYKILFQGNENVLKLTVVTAAQLCKYTRDYGIVYFTWGNCMLYELYFNKTATQHIQNVVWRHNTVKSRQDMTEINLKLKNPYPFLWVAARGSLPLWSQVNSLNGERAGF